MKIIHPAGKKIVILTILLLIAVIAVLVIVRINPWVKGIFISLFLVLAVLITRFFRIPERNFTNQKNIVVAPADGKVVVIEKTLENEYFKKEMIQVSIFMSIHNVHINWIPLKGKVSYYKYHPGKYLVARHPKSSSLNEHASVVISDEQNAILVKQIAGFVARRILTYVHEKDIVEYGMELGFIRFGSRLDLFLPPGSEILVKPGQHVTGGVTPITILKK